MKTDQSQDELTPDPESDDDRDRKRRAAWSKYDRQAERQAELADLRYEMAQEREWMRKE